MRSLRYLPALLALLLAASPPARAQTGQNGTDLSADYYCSNGQIEQCLSIDVTVLGTVTSRRLITER